MKTLVIKNKNKIVVFALSLILIFTYINMEITASEQDLLENLDSSPYEQLGLSASDNKLDDTLIDIYAQGSVEEQTLQIVLEVDDQVDQIKMIVPIGASERDTSAFDSEAMLGYFAPEDFISVIKRVTTHPKINRAILGESTDEFVESHIVVFDAPVYGEYIFELYNKNLESIKRFSYHVRAPFNNIGLDYRLDSATGKKSFYRFDGRVYFDLSYASASSDKKETLTLTLPPFMSMGRIPNSVPGSYTVTERNVLLPAEYYNDPNSAILLNYANTNALYTKQITIDMEATFDETLSLLAYIDNSDTRNSTDDNKYLEISELMVLYGTDYDKIPFKLVAEAKFTDDGTPIDFKELVGDSMLKDDDGNPVAERLVIKDTLPLQPSNTYIYYDGPAYISNKDDLIAGSVPGGDYWTHIPHYPITDIVYYYQQTDSRMVIKPGTMYEVVNLSGEDWYKTKTPIIRHINTLVELSPTMLAINLPDKTTLIPGDVYPQGKWKMEYTYKGVRHQLDIANIKDYTIPGYQDDVESFRQFFNKAAANPNGISTGKERYQDYDGDTFIVSFDKDADSKGKNDVQYPNTKNLEIKTEFPFGYSPTSVNASRLQMIDNITGADTNQYPLVKYRYHGEATWGSIQLSGSSTGYDSATATFPNSTKSIAEVIIRYNDEIPGCRWGSFYTYTIKTGSVDINGDPLGDTFTTKIDTTLSLDNMKRQTDGTPYLDPLVKTLSQELVLVKKPVDVLEDSLRFNTARSSNYLSYSYANSIYTAFDTNKDIMATNPYNTGYGGWSFIVKKSSAKMIDYKNVKIKINSDTEDEKRALSLMGGMYWETFVKVGDWYEKRDVYYTTNLHPSPRKAVVRAEGRDAERAYFDLEKGEYATGVELDLGTIYGENLPDMSSYNKYDKAAYITVSEATRSLFKPTYRDLRDYYSGSSEAVPIENNTTLNMSATISTDTTAKHINDPQPGEYFNDTARGTLRITTIPDAKYIQPAGSIDGRSWNNPSKSYYQGGIVQFTYLASPYVKFTESYVGAEHKITDPYSFATNYYFEVDENFQLLSIGDDWTLEKTIPLPAKKTVVYVFSGIVSCGVQGASRRFPMEFYVRPDTPIINGEYEVIKSCGNATDNLISTYFTPDSGPNAYYTQKYPFAKFTYPDGAFPADWGASDTKFIDTTPAKIVYPTKVTIGRIDTANIQMNPFVQNHSDIQKISFEDHQKDDLGFVAFLNGGGSGELAKYQAKFELPVRGGTTVSLESDNETTYTNQDTLVLADFPSFERDTPSVNLKYTYLDSNGTEIDLENFPTDANFENVKSVVVYFEKFPASTTYALRVPLKLKSGTGKTGADVADRDSYVGAGFIMNGVGNYNTTMACKFTYKSYSLDMRLGIDRNETGFYSELLKDGVVDVKVYYAGSTVPVYSESKGGKISPLVNKDGEKIVVSIKDKYRDTYRITVPDANSNIPDNSDFPSPLIGNIYDSEVVINYQDLINHKKNIYDLNLVVFPNVMANDDTVYYKMQKALNYRMVYKDNSSSLPTTLLNKYDYNLSVADTSVARVDNITTVTGMQKRKNTTYLISGTNSYGNPLSGGAKLNVSPLLLNSTVQLQLAAGSIQYAPSDKFNFTIWPDQLNNADVSLSLNGVLNGYAYVSDLEGGSKHYIQATDLTDGYVIDSISLSYSYSMGGTVPVPVTIENAAKNIYSFQLPDPNVYSTGDMLNATIVVSNRISGMTVKKAFADNSLNLDANQLYSIRIENETIPGINYTGSLKTGDSATVPNIKFGHSYLVTETPVPSHKLDIVNITKPNGDVVSIVPTKVSDWSYRFKIDAEHEGGTITLVNKRIAGGGINLSKELDTRGLSGEQFKFKVESGSTGPGKKFVAYGFVDFSSGTSSGPIAVKWYDKEDSTDPTAKVIDVSALSVGTYSLTEINGTGKTNFILSDFEFSSPNIQKVGDELFITVLESEPTPMSIKAVNQAKTGGSIKVGVVFENNYILSDDVKLTFELKGPKAGGVMPTTPKIIELTKNSNWSYSEDGLSYGEYEISLLDDGLEDYDILSLDIDGVASRAVASQSTFKIGEQANQFIKINANAKVKVKTNGVIEISKEVSGLNTLPNQQFDFVITNPMGVTQTVSIKAGETKRLTGLLLGNYSIKENADDNFEHVGIITNGGASQAVSQVTLMMANPNQSQQLKSISRVKNDASIKIYANFINPEEMANPSEEFTFKISRSIEGGPWEPPTEAGATQIDLQDGQDYTFNNLLRGAKYKVMYSFETYTPSEVRDIQLLEGTEGEIDLAEGSATYQPMGEKRNGKEAFLLDIKRINLVVDKFAGFPISTNPDGMLVLPETIQIKVVEQRNIKLSDAEFVLYRYNNAGEKHTVDRWKQKTDSNGEITFVGLSAGKYSIVETKAPENFKIVARNINFEVQMDMLTGELSIVFDNLAESVYFADNVLSIPNVYDLHSRENPPSKPSSKPLDTDSPIKIEEPENLEPEIEPDDTFISIPNAGGTPIFIIGIAGLAVMVIGLLVKKKK